MTKPSNLLDFKDSGKGQRCFIIGNGPSLKKHDLSRLRREQVFVVNLFTLHEEFHNLRNCFYCLGDPRFYPQQELLSEIADNLARQPTVNCFFEMSARSAIERDSRFTARHRYFVEIDPSQKCWEGDFHANPNRKFCWGYSVILDQCLPLAIFMGFNPIYLLGCDCDYNLDPLNPDFGNAYFYDPKDVSDNYLASLYQSSQLPDQFNMSGKIISSYNTVKAYCEANGIQVFNAGAGGKLDVFQRVAYSSLFK